MVRHTWAFEAWKKTGFPASLRAFRESVRIDSMCLSEATNGLATSYGGGAMIRAEKAGGRAGLTNAPEVRIAVVRLSEAYGGASAVHQLFGAAPAASSDSDSDRSARRRGGQSRLSGP